MADIKEELFVPVNRRKMIGMTLLYSVLGLAGFLVTYYLGENQDWMSPTVFKVASVVVLLFFMVVAGTFAKNIKSTTAGLKISRAGIDDQSSSISHGLIPWKDIIEISKIKTVSSRYILVLVKKPQKYIDNAKNSAIKRLLNQNIALYKTPIVINAGALTMGIDELEGELLRRGGKFGVQKK